MEDHRDVEVLTHPGLLNLQWFWAKSFVQWRITPPEIMDSCVFGLFFVFLVSLHLWV